ncbi:hypothetical protein ACFQZE_24490 [Paenibacillus sp. GCM10027627]|uniref:hypothetical protein n=1 Tax=unclassified Paenibacillus TaxID=185978 RepID=UPI00362A90A7
MTNKTVLLNTLEELYIERLASEDQALQLEIAKEYDKASYHDARARGIRWAIFIVCVNHGLSSEEIYKKNNRTETKRDEYIEKLLKGEALNP